MAATPQMRKHMLISGQYHRVFEDSTVTRTCSTCRRTPCVWEARAACRLLRVSKQNTRTEDDFGFPQRSLSGTNALRLVESKPWLTERSGKYPGVKRVNASHSICPTLLTRKSPYGSYLHGGSSHWLGDFSLVWLVRGNLSLASWKPDTRFVGLLRGGVD